MFLPSAHRTELEVQRDTIDSIPLRLTKNRCGLLRHLLFHLFVEILSDGELTRGSMTMNVIPVHRSKIVSGFTVIRERV